MFKNSSAAVTFDEFTDGGLTKISKPQKSKLPVLPQLAEGFQVENSKNDDLYANRMFVLKMYDSLGKKPSTQELERVASMRSKVDIMQHMVEVAGQKEEFSTRIATEEEEADVVFSPRIVDIDDVYTPIKDKSPGETPITEPQQEPQPEPQRYINTNAPETAPPVASNANSSFESSSSFELIKNPNQKSQVSNPVVSQIQNPAKQYVRDMYMLLGRLDHAIDYGALPHIPARAAALDILLN